MTDLILTLLGAFAGGAVGAVVILRHYSKETR